MAKIVNCAPSLSGKVALVSGGMGGIGRATVEILAAHGAKVIFTFAERFEDPSAAAEFAASIATDTRSISLDLMDKASIEQCVSSARAVWGTLDILVNNAAVGSATVTPYGETVAEQDTAMLRINADGTLAMCQAFLKGIDPDRKQPYKIINLSSVGGGITSIPGFRISDGMSKAAIAFLTRILAADHVFGSVDVFAVCPGATNTRMLQASTLDRLSIDERAKLIERLPKGRLIEPEEIAYIIAFLASDYSSPLNGSVIDASMGLGVRPGLMSEFH